MFTAVDHVEVVANDLDQTLEFYVTVLGFQLSRRVRFETGQYTGEIICVTLGDFMIEIIGPAEAPFDPESRRAGVKLFALRVDDMEKTLEHLGRFGVAASRGPSQGGTFDGLRAEIQDPNGIVIELREWQNGDSASNPDWSPTRPGARRIA